MYQIIFNTKIIYIFNIILLIYSAYFPSMLYVYINLNFLLFRFFMIQRQNHVSPHFFWNFWRPRWPPDIINLATFLHHRVQHDELRRLAGSWCYPRSQQVPQEASQRLRPNGHIGVCSRFQPNPGRFKHANTPINT